MRLLRAGRLLTHGYNVWLCNAILEWFREKGVSCVESDVHYENRESICPFEGLV
ncbi:MAG: hypothetical protein H5T41_07600 [Methanomassiliicoccales archaeon]|nr:hypothetical protein [Methanomassiliicoccales archaeon]